MKTLSVRVVGVAPSEDWPHWSYRTISEVDMGDEAGHRHLSGLAQSKSAAFAEAREIAKTENAEFLGETKF